MKVIVLFFIVIYVASDHVSAVCNGRCTRIYKPVCGGPVGGPYATFGNECEYNYANCINGNEFQIFTKFACEKECEEGACPMIYDPVCAGPDGGPYTTYSNKCVYYGETCKKHYGDHITHTGEC